MSKEEINKLYERLATLLGNATFQKKLWEQKETEILREILALNEKAGIASKSKEQDETQDKKI